MGAVFVFQYGLGYQPCKLCLSERIPYYVGAPLAGLLALAPRRNRVAIAGGLVVLGVVFLIGAGLGIHHAGVEWGWWLGPSDCGGPAGAATARVDDFLGQLGKARVVSCDAAAWTFLGLSMAGWNAVVSLILAFAAFAGARIAFRLAPAAWRRAD